MCECVGVSMFFFQQWIQISTQTKSGTASKRLRSTNRVWIETVEAFQWTVTAESTFNAVMDDLRVSRRPRPVTVAVRIVMANWTQCVRSQVAIVRRVYQQICTDVHQICILHGGPRKPDHCLQVCKYDDIQNTDITTEHFGIRNAFLRHHMQELQTFKMVWFLPTLYL